MPENTPKPPPISPEDAEKVLRADVKNLVKKVAEGKTLTVAERSKLEAMAVGAKDGIAYAKSLVELAEILGVTRRTLNNWKKLEGAPQAMPNGDWNVADWREFVRRHDLKGSDTNQGPDDAALKARKLLAEVEEKELKIAVLKGQYVSVDTVREEWIGLVAHATSILRAKFENELPPILSGLDASGIQQECRKAIDEVLLALHRDGDSA